MNEEQSDELIRVLRGIKSELAEANRKKQIPINSFNNLKEFKIKIISDEFFSTLNKKQKQFILDAGKLNVPRGIKVKRRK